MGATFRQLVDLNAKGFQGFGCDLAPDFHTVVPARKEKVSICANEDLFGRVTFRQFGQCRDTLAHFRIELVPPIDACVADHSVSQTKNQHHFGQVHIVRDCALRRRGECHCTVTALNTGFGRGQPCAEAERKSAENDRFHSIFLKSKVGMSGDWCH